MKRQKELEIQHESMIAVDVVGKDQGVWEKRKNRFLERIHNTLESVLNSEIPGRGKIHEEAAELLKNAVESMQAIVKKPQLTNIEKTASINRALSEMRLRNAEADQIELNNELLKSEVEDKKWNMELQRTLHSQEYLKRLMLSGELYAQNDEGKLTFIYCPLENKTNNEEE